MTRAARQQGFASVLAVATIAIFAMATTAMMWRIRHEMFYLHAQERELELRQLLVVGAASAGRAADNPGESIELELPADLTPRASVVLESIPGADTGRTIVIRVTLEGAKASQTLTMERVSDRWVVVGVDWGANPHTNTPAD